MYLFVIIIFCHFILGFLLKKKKKFNLKEYTKSQIGYVNKLTVTKIVHINKENFNHNSS